MHVGCVGEHALMKPIVIRHFSCSAHPDSEMGWSLVRVDGIDWLDGARFDGLRCIQPLSMLCWDVFPDLLVVSGRIRCFLGRGYIGHGCMMFEPFFLDLKRNRHAENRAAVLDGNDSACGKAASIANSIDFVEDRDLRVTRPEEITLQRMNLAIFDRSIRRDEGLTNDLSTEDALGTLLGASPPKQVELDLLEIEKVD